MVAVVGGPLQACGAGEAGGRGGNTPPPLVQDPPCWVRYIGGATGSCDTLNKTILVNKF